jgi:hypothetical protein
MSDNTDDKGQPLAQDTAYYNLLFSNSPARIPAGYPLKLDDRTTYELMLDRDSKKAE